MNMNRIIISFTAVMCAGGVGFGILQNTRLRTIADEAAALRAELQASREAALKANKTAANANDATTTAAENIERLKRERDEALRLARSASASGASLAYAGSGAGSLPAQPHKEGLLSGIAKVFESAEGKKMMASQTTAVTRMHYGDLARTLQLKPADTEVLMALLAERQLAISEDSVKMLDGKNFDEEAMQKFGEAMMKQNEDFDAKVKAVLGEEGFARFQEYEDTLGDRLMMKQYDEQFSLAGVPLQSRQWDKLLGIMQAERKKVVAPVLSAQAAPESAGTVEHWVAGEENFQQRVLSAAPTALSPDQVIVLKKVLAESLEVQKFGIKLGDEMTKGK